MIRMQKKTLSHSSRIFHSYAVELNSKLFFVSSTYFIHLLYLKRKEWKCWVLSDLFQAFKINFFFICIVDENINFMFPSKYSFIFKLGSIIVIKPKTFGFGMTARSKTFPDSGILGLAWQQDPRCLGVTCLSNLRRLSLANR